MTATSILRGTESLFLSIIVIDRDVGRIAEVGGIDAYAILNDVEQPILQTVLSAFRNYDVQPVPWSKRDAARKELVA